jgi:hypothetical protein
MFGSSRSLICAAAWPTSALFFGLNYGVHWLRGPANTGRVACALTDQSRFGISIIRFAAIPQIRLKIWL